MDGGGFVLDEEAPNDVSGPGFTGTSCCQECGCLSYSQDFFRAFQVMVCAGCKRTDKFQLIPKGTAKTSYLLTDGDLRKLGCITKSNPQRKQWSDMKLYLQLQVAELALQKHGSAESIQDAKQQRVQARLTNRLERSKRAAEDNENEDIDEHDAAHNSILFSKKPLTAAQQRVRDRLLAEYGTGTGNADHRSTCTGRWIEEPGASTCVQTCAVQQAVVPGIAKPAKRSRKLDACEDQAQGTAAARNGTTKPGLSADAVGGFESVHGNATLKSTRPGVEIISVSSSEDEPEIRSSTQNKDSRHRGESAQRERGTQPEAQLNVCHADVDQNQQTSHGPDDHHDIPRITHTVRRAAPKKDKQAFATVAGRKASQGQQQGPTTTPGNSTLCDLDIEEI